MTEALRVIRVVAIAAIVVFLALAWTQQDAPAALAAFDDSDGDGAVDIEETVFGSDPANPASTPEALTAEFMSEAQLCSDGVDNDLDGLTDGADPGCTDSDFDGPSDSVEAFLGSDPFDSASLPENAAVDALFLFFGVPFATCDNDFDDDLDGLTDGADPGCTPIDGDSDGFEDAIEKRFGSDPSDPASVPEHDVPNPGSCIDGMDNDGDGAVDGADPACGIPANDNFADATVALALPFTDSLKTTSATTEAGEPSPSCAPIANTVWYSFTPAEETLLIADTIGSDFDTVLAVRTESATFGLAQVACNDDSSSSLQSRLAFQASAGQTYFFQVGGFFDSAGNLTFNLDIGSPPVNDDFADAITITTLPFSHSVDTSAAIIEPSEPTPSCLFFEDIASTVWYSYTPSDNAFLLADTAGSGFFGTAIGVYQGTSLADLTPVSCGAPSFPDTRLAFEASSGQTYFFQVGGLSFSGPFQGGGRWSDGGFFQKAGRPDTSGFGSSGNLVFNLDVFAVPPCAPVQFSVEDPTGDTIGFDPSQHDIVSLSGGSDAENFCLTVEFAGPVEPPDTGSDQAVSAIIDFDTDGDPSTGIESQNDFHCPDPAGLGVEAQVFMFGGSGLLVPIFQFFEGPVPLGFPPDELFGTALFDETSFTLIIPLAALGGDDSFRFAMFVESDFFGPTDCAPNGGFISSPTPVTPGDVDCGDSVNSIDAALVLQLVAGLVDSLACQDAADVDGDGEITSIDAALILQFDAGVLDSLPT